MAKKIDATPNIPFLLGIIEDKAPISSHETNFDEVS
jgi:hypothetical protein